MDVNMEDGGVRGIGGLPEGSLGVSDVVERPRAPEIQQNMSAGGIRGAVAG